MSSVISPWKPGPVAIFFRKLILSLYRLAQGVWGKRNNWMDLVMSEKEEEEKIIFFNFMSQRFFFVFFFLIKKKSS